MVREEGVEFKDAFMRTKDGKTACVHCALDTQAIAHHTCRQYWISHSLSRDRTMGSGTQPVVLACGRVGLHGAALGGQETGRGSKESTGVPREIGRMYISRGLRDSSGPRMELSM
jgi:hypothetical protein